MRGECAGHVCKPLISFHVNAECNGCNLCKLNCPYDAVSGEKKKGDTYKIDQEKCTKCRICHQSCKFGAIDIKTGTHG
jgi:NADH-quinone oxidoreductase subunit F